MEAWEPEPEERIRASEASAWRRLAAFPERSEAATAGARSNARETKKKAPRPRGRGAGGGHPGPPQGTGARAASVVVPTCCAGWCVVRLSRWSTGDP